MLQASPDVKETASTQAAIAGLHKFEKDRPGRVQTQWSHGLSSTKLCSTMVSDMSRQISVTSLPADTCATQRSIRRWSVP